MKMQRMFLGLALACGMVGTVQADTLASGTVYGGRTQTRVACQVFNAGNTPISFASTQIFSQFQAPVPQTFNNCGTALAANRICTFQAAANDQAFSCKVQILQVKTNVRGTMTALNFLAIPLSESDLR
ncbi:MAG: hypothetical protein HOP18_23895 [Deltaproteobacteria bacterium]|nr:hypothetical protein [Deltaproteobacteria bacterium]